jgi:superfamily II DNA or RNA helicase
MKLYPEQDEAVQSIDRYRQRSNKLILGLAVGLGKTFTASWYVKNRLIDKGKVLILVHTKYLLNQFHDEGIKNIDLNIRAYFEQGDSKIGIYEYEDAEVILGTMQSVRSRLHKYKPQDFSGVVIDECFPAGTKLWSLGRRRQIQHLVVGSTVDSYNHETKQIESKTVTTMFKKRPKGLLTLRLATGQKITCTLEHPFYTPKGYKEARFCYRDSIMIRNDEGDRMGFIFVEDIEYHEQTRDGTFGGRCPDGFVYNIEVEDNNNYFVENCLVHNCHRTMGDSYVKILDHFGLNKQGQNWNKDTLLLGLTATPYRGNAKEDLKKVYDEIAYQIDIKQGIKRGLVTNIDLSRVKTHIPMEVKKKMGDYSIKELTEAIDTPIRNQLIVDAYREKAIEGQTLVFASSIEHSRNLAETFKVNGFEAGYVDSKQDKLEQDEVVKSFKSGSLPILCNVTLFTEGFNHKPIRNLILARPTKSPVLMVQMVGRGTRVMEGKDRVKVIDITDSWKGNNPLNVLDLFGITDGDDETNIKEKIEKVEKALNRNIRRLVVPMEQEIIDEGLLVNVFEDIDKEKLGKYIWIQTDEDEWYLGVGKLEQNGNVFFNTKLYLKRKMAEYELSVEYEVGKEKRSGFVGAFNDMKQVESKVKKIIAEQERLYVLDANWRFDRATDPQINFIKTLMKKKGNSNVTDAFYSELNKGQAQILINLLQL